MIVYAPSATMLEPTTKEDSGLAKNNTTLAISDGSPKRLSGCNALNPSSPFSISPVSLAPSIKPGVIVVPGATALTLMPCGNRDIADALVMDAIPPLDAWYARYPGEPTIAKVEEKLMIDPPLC
eukprot:gnl/Chilomastix_caulleri/869.p2 GENE.gnl/Chilomastix_caulleri/869~~gnl/Chilomastix_caulleri/869.p2  ORF type:complete len:124 (+),score=37.75 gnl/Chilomastix_caulleri/869:139-510(+)